MIDICRLTSAHLVSEMVVVSITARVEEGFPLDHCGGWELELN